MGLAFTKTSPTPRFSSKAPKHSFPPNSFPPVMFGIHEKVRELREDFNKIRETFEMLYQAGMILSTLFWFLFILLTLYSVQQRILGSVTYIRWTMCDDCTAIDLVLGLIGSFLKRFSEMFLAAYKEPAWLST